MALQEFSLDINSLRTEERVLLGCARTRLEDGNVYQLSGLLGPSFNWERLLTLALHHELTPFLVKHFVQTQRFQEIPIKAKDALQHFFRKHVLFSQMLGKELGSIMQSFNREKIRAIPIKGPTLAVRAYGALELRMFNDLDVLVKDQDISKASTVLLNHGYRYRTNSDENLKESTPEQTSHRYHTFVDQTGMIGLDIQSRIEGSQFSFQIDHNEFWDDLQQVAIAGNSISCLPDPKLLLVLCIHGSKHLWCRLKWICDVGELLKSSPHWDWEKTLQMATVYQCKTMLLLGLNLTQVLFSTKLSEQLRQEIQNCSRISYLTNHVLFSLFPSYDQKPAPIPPAAFFLNIIDQPWDRWRYWLRLSIGQSPDAYHTPLGPDSLLNRLLYMMVQPFRILGKYTIRSQRFKNTLGNWLGRTD